MCVCECVCARTAGVTIATLWLGSSGRSWGKPAHSSLTVSASVVIDGATAATADSSKMLRGLSQSDGSREEGSEMGGLDG